MSWGDEDWAGHEWGPGEIGATRMHRFLREGPNVRALVDLLDARAGKIYAELLAMLGTLDLDTVIGQPLDVLGAWVHRARLGMSHARFRRAIRAQIVALGSNGSNAAVRAVWAAWIREPADWYRTLPAEIEIGGDVDVPDERDLFAFLTATVPGGVRFSVASYDPLTVLRGDYSSDPITGVGETDYSTDPISGAALVATTVYP